MFRFKLPDVCSYQQINYTIILEEYVDNATVNTLLNGPYNHQGPGVVSHGIGGLKNDCTYSARVQVNHITGITESAKHHFSTPSNLHTFTIMTLYNVHVAMWILISI